MKDWLHLVLKANEAFYLAYQHHTDSERLFSLNHFIA